MSDVNELLHAIRLAETLALGVAFEEGQIRSTQMMEIRDVLSQARIGTEIAALGAGIELIDDHADLDDRLQRAMTAIAKGARRSVA